MDFVIISSPINNIKGFKLWDFHSHMVLLLECVAIDKGVSNLITIKLSLRSFTILM